MRSRISYLTVLLLATCLITTQSYSQIPQTLSVQGVLIDDTGQAVQDGTNYTFATNIYNVETGGSPLWTDTIQNVTVEDGVYSLVLGNGTNSLSSLSFNELYFLELVVSDGPTGLAADTLSRTPLSAAGYELNTHLQDLADGTLSGSKVGSGINASNITSGTISDARLESTINVTNVNVSADLVAGDDVVAGDDMFVGDAIYGTGTYLHLRSDNTNGPIFRLDNGTGGGMRMFNYSQANYVLRIYQYTTSSSTLNRLVSFTVDDVFVGAITENGAGTVTYGSFTGVHLGIMGEKAAFGELVQNSGIIIKTGDKEGSEPIYRVAKSNTANCPDILGSYSSLHDDEWNLNLPGDIVTIMAVGNGFMWVVDNGKDIQAGDPLISSNTAGHGMRDNGDYDIAHVIAKAGENVSWNDVTTTLNGKKHKLISVFYESFTINHLAWKNQERIDQLENELKILKQLMGLEANN